ncbi:MerR family transcriptional regulator [Streptomyces sp. NPDC050504]|uniref:MerR family transcriptional regulator n=1 Tax=Streptomyces sp. NPDC050504 TaxID=3365618 RepID=UPI00379BC898
MSDAAAWITTGALALRLGVAPTTLRSWDKRYGLGPALRGDGRHRRWSPADVAVVERMCGLTARGVPPAEAARLARLTVPAAVPVPAAPVPAAPAPPGPAVPADPVADAPATADAPGGFGGRSALGVPGLPPVRSALALPGAREPVDLCAVPGGEVFGAPAVPDPLAEPPALSPSGEARRVVRGLGKAAVRLDASQVERLLTEAVADHGLAGAWDRVMMPALRAIGRRWATSGDPVGERYVEAEHMLSWYVSTVVRRAGPTVAPTLDPPGGEGERPVVLACAPGEFHSLAVEVLAMTLAERAVPVRMFGSAVPVAALADAVRRTGPRAVVVWSQRAETADAAQAVLLGATKWGIAGARTRPVVLLAGPGWHSAGRRPGMCRLGSLPQALEVLALVAGD